MYRVPRFRQPSWRLGLQWFLGTLIGAAAGFFFLSYLSMPLIQTLVLRPWITRAWRWLPMSAAAIVGSMVLSSALADRLLLTTVVSGLMIGTSQYSILQSETPRAKWWIVVTIVAVTTPVLVSTQFPAYQWMIVLIGYALITALGLPYILPMTSKDLPQFCDHCRSAQQQVEYVGSIRETDRDRAIKYVQSGAYERLRGLLVDGQQNASPINVYLQHCTCHPAADGRLLINHEQTNAAGQLAGIQLCEAMIGQEHVSRLKRPLGSEHVRIEQSEY